MTTIRHTAPATDPANVPEAAYTMPNPITCICGRQYQYANQLGAMFSAWAEYHKDCEATD